MFIFLKDDDHFLKFGSSEHRQRGNTGLFIRVSYSADVQFFVFYSCLLSNYGSVRHFACVSPYIFCN